jgi:hypothetical protein
LDAGSSTGAEKLPRKHREIVPSSTATKREPRSRLRTLESESQVDKRGNPLDFLLLLTGKVAKISRKTAVYKPLGRSFTTPILTSKM